MSRSLNGSNQYLRVASAVGDVPFTVAGWLKPAALNTWVFTRCTTATNDNFHYLIIGSGGECAVGSAPGYPTAVSSTTTTTGVWAHLAGVWASTTSRSAYLNGGGKVTNTTMALPAALPITNLGRYEQNAGTGGYTSGLMAEWAVWNVALTDAEIAALATGICPLLMRPSAVIAYWPLWGLHSTEIDLHSRIVDSNSYDLTLGNSPAADLTGPPVEPFSRQFWNAPVMDLGGGGSAVSPGIVNRGLVNNSLTRNRIVA